MNEITYKFDDFVISYDKGHNKDRSALLISKIDKINICILGELYDESADIVNTIINNLQQENKQLKEQLGKLSKLDDTDFWLEYNRDVWKIQNENEKLKELISVILNWNIFKNECPMNFGYDKNTIEDKSQEVFCQDDDYCENNCNEDYQKCWLKYFKKMQELGKGENNESNS